MNQNQIILLLSATSLLLYLFYTIKKDLRRSSPLWGEALQACPIFICSIISAPSEAYPPGWG